MIKFTGIATILGLALTAACATDTGSQRQELATGDFADSDERCYLSADDFDGTDLLPPPISVSIGDSLISAPDAMVAARSEKRAGNDGYAQLLTAYVVAQVGIDAGAELDEDVIDSLVEAEDMLVRLDPETDSSYAIFEADILDLIADLSDFNYSFRVRVPCMNTDDAGVFEVDAPLNDDRPKMYAPRWGRKIVGASAEDSAQDDGNGFHRPQRRRNLRRFKATRQHRGLR